MSKRRERRQLLRLRARKPLEDYGLSPYGLSRANRRKRLERIAAEGPESRSNQSAAPVSRTERAKRMRVNRAYKRMARRNNW